MIPKDTMSNLNLEISEDKLKAYLNVPFETLKGLSLDDLLEVLAFNNITFGFDSASLEAILTKAKAMPAHEGGMQKIIIASGKPPTLPKNGKINHLISETKQVNLGDDGKADFRNIDKFRQIEKGTVLAERIPPQKGEEGRDIFSNVIPTVEPDDPKLNLGNNIFFSEKDNKYYATEKGIYSFEDNVISVKHVLYIEGNAGISSGNLVYDGGVHIKGNIERGAIVAASEDLKVDGFIESNLIRVGKTAVVQRGINSGRDGNIYIKGSLHTNYIDNSHVVILGDAIVDRSIVTSNIISHGDVTLQSHRSVIVGGDICVYGSIIASQIGSIHSAQTNIVIGLHHINNRYFELFQKQLDNTLKIYEVLNDKILTYKDMAQRKKVSSEFQQKIRATYNEYLTCRKLSEKLKEQIKYYRMNSINPKPVRISASESIHSGVEIRYKNIKHLIKNKLHATTIEFKPDSLEPVYLPYTSTS